MSATKRAGVDDLAATGTDDEVRAQLARVLSDTLDRVSFNLWDSSDSPSREDVDSALAFVVRARAIVRTFEDGPQDAAGDDVLGLDRDGDMWSIGAGQWQRERENQATRLAIQGGRNAG